MTKKELIRALEELSKRTKDPIEGDPQGNHVEADLLLLKFVNDEEVSIAFHDIKKWYS